MCCLFFLVGCSTGAALRRTPAESPPSAPSPPAPTTNSQSPDLKETRPRAIAALTLSDQARALLEQDKPDQAIRLLERAINLHPQNGEAYYYLAEAWLRKGNFDQALEFNRLADLYFKDDNSWLQRIAFQKNRIHRLQP